MSSYCRLEPGAAPRSDLEATDGGIVLRFLFTREAFGGSRSTRARLDDIS